MTLQKPNISIENNYIKMVIYIYCYIVIYVVIYYCHYIVLCCLVLYMYKTLQKPLYFNRKPLHENASVEKIKNKHISFSDKT